MSITIISNKRPEKYFILRNRSQVFRGSISRENRQEYDNEKRAKELHRKMPDSPVEYNAAAVAKMMRIDEHKARKLILSNSKGVILDGKID